MKTGDKTQDLRMEMWDMGGEAGALELKRMHEAVVASSARGPNASKRYAPTSGPKMNAILAIATHRPISRSPPPARLRRASNSGCTCSNVPTHTGD